VWQKLDEEPYDFTRRRVSVLVSNGNVAAALNRISHPATCQFSERVPSLTISTEQRALAATAEAVVPYGWKSFGILWCDSYAWNCSVLIRPDTLAGCGLPIALGNLGQSFDKSRLEPTIWRMQALPNVPRSATPIASMEEASLRENVSQIKKGLYD